jgi:hypothetical protein
MEHSDLINPQVTFDHLTDVSTPDFSFPNVLAVGQL